MKGWMEDSRLMHIQSLVGLVTPEQLRHVDCFLGDKLGVFMPITGPCYYAVSPLHTHPSYMFTLSFDDRTALSINDKVVIAHRGKLSALSPDIPHHELYSEETPRYMAIFIDKAFFHEQLEGYPMFQTPLFQGESYPYQPALTSALREFMTEADNTIPGAEALKKALGVQICHLIIRSILNLSCRQERIRYRLEINKTIDYMHVHFGNRIRVEDLAQIAHMSVSYYARLFKKETGQSPMDYLNQLRLTRAKKLLLEGQKSISDISVETGFQSPAYLSTCFYKSYKMSPSAYRLLINAQG